MARQKSDHGGGSDIDRLSTLPTQCCAIYCHFSQREPP
ncbi:hypothetical protein A2U01_0119141, partial [Trifolium medium]|nr:hypothetical protein [Trifolium medium]